MVTTTTAKQLRRNQDTNNLNEENLQYIDSILMFTTFSLFSETNFSFAIFSSQSSLWIVKVDEWRFERLPGGRWQSKIKNPHWFFWRVKIKIENWLFLLQFSRVSGEWLVIKQTILTKLVNSKNKLICLLSFHCFHNAINHRTTLCYD